MRAHLQRTTQAKVEVNGETLGQIETGLLVLLGIEAADSQEDIDWLAKKIVSLRIFDDEDGQMNRSLLDAGGGILLISQFTLHASTKKGNRPSYLRAARPEIAEPLYEEMAKTLGIHLGHPIATGQFGANMQITLTNNGPVTILIDTKDKI